MIKANELRLGNLIEVIGLVGPTKIIGGVSVEIGKPLPIGAFDSIERIGTALYELVNPIPLTAAWLQRFGFVDPAGNGAALRLSINSADELCFYCLGVPELRYQTKGSGFTRDFNVKYVHQLQNLYFALTGEELMVKAEPTKEDIIRVMEDQVKRIKHDPSPTKYF